MNPAETPTFVPLKGPDAMTDKIGIPERHQEFCRAVAKLCREFDLTKFGGSYTPGFGDAWRQTIQFSWDQGRHGAASNDLRIWSQLDVQTHIDLLSQPPSRHV